MPAERRRRLATAVLCAIGAVAGLIVAVIVVLNLHIVAGLEEGYAATPAQVVDHSPVLAAVDAVFLVATPMLGVLVALWILRRVRRSVPR